jgi:murein DD-endopeptidase MepM/ murein hydrolase activator NlpD
VYQYDANGEHAYYYAHLDAFAEGLKEGMQLRRGDPIGFVGTTGNASPTAPHLHFAIIRLDADKKWLQGGSGEPLPVTSLTPTPSAARRIDLDWIRILAFASLILYHVGMYYVTWGWHVKSPHASHLAEPLMMLVNPWRLSLLFLVSGGRQPPSSPRACPRASSPAPAGCACCRRSSSRSP